MSSRAMEFLTEWSLKRDNAPIPPIEARAIAERWEEEAIENGIAPGDLRAAAGGTVTAYLLRTFGEAG